MSENKKIRIQVILPVATDAYNREVRISIAEICPPDCAFEVTNIDHGVEAIENRTTWAINNPGNMEKAKEAEAKGFDGVYICDFDMSGVEMARELCDIPVVGACRAQAYTAMFLTQRFAIITLQQQIVDFQIDHMRTFGIDDNMAAIKPLGLSVEGLTDRSKVIAAAIKAGVECVTDHNAESIIFGCAGYVDIAEEVSKGISDKVGAYVPVTDSNKISFLYLYSMIKTNLRPGRLTYAKVSLPPQNP